MYVNKPKFIDMSVRFYFDSIYNFTRMIQDECRNTTKGKGGGN